ncbi:hypothetical protein GDO81_009890 [Engystomops pustulosus]|uniref:CYTH domain-containing protein n=1 Tax=Engystomops pustulosus TaxID=76066 RepID=A0AAV7BUZ8_ENGPU|nr:hypothetical protein GDO81_009890 [Engystomops pustulosus]
MEPQPHGKNRTQVLNLITSLKNEFPGRQQRWTVLTQALGVRGQVVKERFLFLVGQTRIHLDRVKDLGDFVELEVVLTESQTAQDGDLVAQELMNSLKISQDDLLTGAYMDLLQKTGNK